MKPRSRRTADLTGKRLGRAVLGYLISMVAVITFSPFRFATSPQHGFTNLWGLTDLLLNIVLFVPLGFVFQLTRPKSASLNGWQALCFGARAIPDTPSAIHCSTTEICCNVTSSGAAFQTTSTFPDARAPNFAPECANFQNRAVLLFGITTILSFSCENRDICSAVKRIAANVNHLLFFFMVLSRSKKFPL